MASFINNKNLVVIIDPGFGSTKVIVNGLKFSIPNAVIDVTGHTKEFLEFSGSKRQSGYLLSRYVPNKEYMVGEMARKSSLEKKEREDYIHKHDMMDSKNRFETTDFEINLMTCIGAALIKYSNVSKQMELKPELDLSDPQSLASYSIFLGIALPNDWVDDVAPTITKFVVGKHNYEVDTETGTYKLQYEIGENNVLCASQAICALIGTAYSDDGNLLPNCNTLKNLPALIIDGGYRTVGIFQLTTANRVSEAESNTNFAMSNVHKAVATVLQEKYERRNIFDFMIPSIIEEKNGLVNYLNEAEDGTVISQTVDAKKILIDKQKEVCDELIKYLDAKFDNFLEIKQIIITGGTGAAYYDQILEWIEKYRGHLRGQVILTNYQFLNEPIDPIYGVAVGLYKTIRNQISRAYKKANRENEAGVNEIKGKAIEKKPNAPKNEPTANNAKSTDAVNALKNKPVNGVAKIKTEE